MEVNVFLKQLQKEPYNHDFFHTLRRIECFYPHLPRLGKALLPDDEPIRLAQEPSLIFAPSSLALLEIPDDDSPPRLQVRFLGLLGVNGPLPLHLTEYARERLLHFNDPTFSRFLDIFHHRFLALFYRAWAQAQPEIHLDRPKKDRFTTNIGALQGVNRPTETFSKSDLHYYASLHFSGLLSRQIRNADGLIALLSGYFKLPFRLESFVGHWMTIASQDQTQLGHFSTSSQLGIGTVIGSRVWDRQHKFRLFLGPLTLSQFNDFLPGSLQLKSLVLWIKHYLCLELEWDLCLILNQNEVPQIQLGQHFRLGWNTWLGNRQTIKHAEDLILT